MPLTNKPINDIGELNAPFVTEYLDARNREEAERVVKYAQQYGAVDIEVVQSADGPECVIILNMLPMELMRIYGYLNGIAKQD